MQVKRQYIRRFGNIKYSDIEKLNYKDGKPYVNIYNENGEKNEEYNVLVSITHDIKNAIAMVVIEKRR